MSPKEIPGFTDEGVTLGITAPVPEQPVEEPIVQPDFEADLQQKQDDELLDQIKNEIMGASTPALPYYGSFQKNPENPKYEQDPRNYKFVPAQWTQQINAAGRQTRFGDGMKSLLFEPEV